MKKVLSFALMALAMGFVFVSCDNEKETPEEDKTVTIINTLPVSSIQGVTVDDQTSYTLSLSLNKANQVYLSNDTTNSLPFGYYRDDIEVDPFELTHSYSAYGLGGGFTFCSCTDATTAGYTNISAITKKGVKTNAYLTVYTGSWDTPAEISFQGNDFYAKECYVTNSTYAYLAIKNQKDGNPEPLVKKWTDKDIFTLTITGYYGRNKTEEISVPLADGMDILNTWKKVDLSDLGLVDRIGFTLSSTDNGQYGMNTPAYFCLDQLTVIEADLK